MVGVLVGALEGELGDTALAGLVETSVPSWRKSAAVNRGISIVLAT